ncbi:MAG: helix-turn-helix domain-containing protein, partial [Flammeovirgaceae bacterium]
DLLSVSQIQISKKASQFADLFKLMETELQNEKDTSQSDMLKHLLHIFLLLSERERRKKDFNEIKKGADLDHVMLFKDLLEIHYRKLKHVNDYAKLISVTDKRLNQATKNVFDKSPKQLIDERVVLEAKRLLAHTNESVKEISFAMGFDEPTNFIKFFRKHSQSTPVEFIDRFDST